MKLILWHSLEFTLEATLVKFLSTTYVIRHNHTWRNRLIFNLYFNCAKEKIVLQTLKEKCKLA